MKKEMKLKLIEIMKRYTYDDEDFNRELEDATINETDIPLIADDILLHFFDVVSSFEPTYKEIKSSATKCMDRFPSYDTKEEREEHILQSTTMFEVMLKTIKDTKAQQ